MAARAGGRRKEVEDPNNTWNMQLMAAALRGDLAEAANLVTKGASVNHTVAEPSLGGLCVTPFMAVALRCTGPNVVGMAGNPNTAPTGALPFAEAVTVLQWLCQHDADPNAHMTLEGKSESKGTLMHHLVRNDFSDLLDKVLLNRHVISQEPPPQEEAPAAEEKATKGRGGKSKKPADEKKEEEVAKIAATPAAPGAGEDLPAVEADAAEVAAPEQPEKPPRDLFDLTVRDATSLSAMQLAVNLGKLEMGRTFVKHGIAPEFHLPVDGRRTQAARACVLGNASALEVLLNLGDDVMQLDSDGQSLVHLSVNSPACLDVLLDRGVNLNVSNATGQSALSWLVVNTPEATDGIDALISRGVDVNVGDALLGTTPLMHAVMGYAGDVARRLIIDGKADVNATDRMGCTALHYAAAARLKGMLEQLVLVEGADINAQDGLGQTPLHRACHVRGKEEFVAFLVTKDALDVNIVDRKGNTALQVAVQRGNEAAVKAMFPRVDATMITGPLPPGVPPPAPAPAATGKGDAKKPAAKKGAPAAPEVVISKVEVNRENAAGLTALQIASRADNESMITTLLSIGADPRRASEFGNLVHEAVVHQRPSLVRLLAGERHAGANDRNSGDYTPLHLAVQTGNPDVVAALLETGAHPNDQDTTHLHAPLHIAVGLQQSEIRDLLVSAGASVDCRDAQARTPLHIACSVGDSRSVFALLSQGATVTARNADGMTPLHVACANDAVECIDDLLRAGADFWARDDRQRTPLHSAVACGSEKCTEKLCDYIVAYNAEGEAALPARTNFVENAAAMPELAPSIGMPSPDIPTPVADSDTAPASASAADGTADDGATSSPKDLAATKAGAADRQSPIPARPESRQTNGSRRAPSASSLNPVAVIEHDGVAVAIDGAAARASHLRKVEIAKAASDWRDALKLQDRDGAYPLALAAASGSPAVAKTLVKTRAALTARSRGTDGLPPRPPSVQTRGAMESL